MKQNDPQTLTRNHFESFCVSRFLKRSICLVFVFLIYPIGLIFFHGKEPKVDNYTKVNSPVMRLTKFFLLCTRGKESKDSFHVISSRNREKAGCNLNFSSKIVMKYVFLTSARKEIRISTTKVFKVKLIRVVRSDYFWGKRFTLKIDQNKCQQFI